jgi:hypothetical protein
MASPPLLDALEMNSGRAVKLEGVLTMLSWTVVLLT